MVRKKHKAVLKAKKKEATAQATIRKGKGVVRINSLNLNIYGPNYVREMIREPLYLAGDLSNEVDIDVDVMGGGVMGQAIASRAAIAKALVDFSGNDKLKKQMVSYDRMLLVDDARRVEPKKPLGPKARRKKQHSKR
jgi:small subunit ribosomal protein S9